MTSTQQSTIRDRIIQAIRAEIADMDPDGDLADYPEPGPGAAGNSLWRAWVEVGGLLRALAAAESVAVHAQDGHPVPLPGGETDALRERTDAVTTTTHFAGVPVQVDTRLRQRCAWCGHLLIDAHLDHIASPDPIPPRTWSVGALVTVDNTGTWKPCRDHAGPLPADACAYKEEEA